MSFFSFFLQKTDAYKLTDSQKTDAYKLTDSQKTDAYKLTDSQKIDAYKPMDYQKIDEYEMTGAHKKSEEYELMDSQKIDEYEMTGAQKITDEYEIVGALNPCVQTRKVKNPCMKNSSCVGVRKNDGVEIIHNYKRKRTCQDGRETGRPRSNGR